MTKRRKGEPRRFHPLIYELGDEHGHSRPCRPVPYSDLNVGFHCCLVRCWRKATAAHEQTMEVSGIVNTEATDQQIRAAWR
ncbi:hypothetical protein N7527_010601 [Penicillium freii]|nr:hypothetical protein N7527_010601 [Penicillium freii]